MATPCGQGGGSCLAEPGSMLPKAQADMLLSIAAPSQSRDCFPDLRSHPGFLRCDSGLLFGK